MLAQGTRSNRFWPLPDILAPEEVSYRPNTTTNDGSILLWNTNGTYTSGTYYSPNTLWVTDVTDEDGLETRIFKDLNGHTVLKRQMLSGGNLDTYYIYNAAGTIYYIVPPKAIAVMVAAGTYSLTDTGVPALIFTYNYDFMGRLSSKTVPGGVTVSIIYDPYNRPVLMQDANMAAKNEWNYMKYDVKGRVIAQGIYTDATHNTPALMQSYVSGLTYTTWYEIRATSATLNGYYTNNVFPTATASMQGLAYQYYDNYTPITGTTYGYHTTGLIGELGATLAQVKGMPTILQQSTVSNTVTAVWLTKVQYYDQNLHPIQVQSNNLLYSSATTTDYSTSVPDFTGMPLVILVSKKTGTSTTTTVQTNITYDQVYRVTAVSQSYNGATAVQVAAYTYNEVGQPVKKSLGQVTSGIPISPILTTTYSGTNAVTASQSITMNPATGGITGFNVPSASTFRGYISTGYLQVVDYRYNIRGQLLSINNSKLTNDFGVTCDDPNPVFGMSFLYDGTDGTLNNGTGNTSKYDGRVSAVKWMSQDGVGYERSYTFAYDGVNRYTGETYSERTALSTGNFSNNVHGFDETVTGYDAGGNITGLTRNSSTEGTNTNVQIDNLTYGYSSATPNQLSTVTDGTGSSYTSYGFRMLDSIGAYGYDSIGNLNVDHYKGIRMSYNFLNKTDKVSVTTATGNYINYIYDASGSLIRKLQYVGGMLNTTTEYLDGFVYLNGALSFFNMPEGRVIYSGGTFTQEYVITDNEGNARVSFQNNGSGVAVVKQENSYYGFGLLLPNSPVTTPPVPNRDMYNGGSEWQNDYGNLPDYYQTFNRNYDQAIGRFVSVDPEPESAESMSNYQYAGNNPIMMNDPDGNKAANPNASIIMEEDEAGMASAQNYNGNMPGFGAGGAGGGIGLFYSDPEAYWNYYAQTNGTMGGTTLYLAPTLNSVGVGNLAGAIAATPVLLNAATRGAAVDVYVYNDGRLYVDTKAPSGGTVSVQNARNAWGWANSGGDDGNQGGDYIIQNGQKVYVSSIPTGTTYGGYNTTTVNINVMQDGPAKKYLNDAKGASGGVATRIGIGTTAVSVGDLLSKGKLSDAIGGDIPYAGAFIVATTSAIGVAQDNVAGQFGHIYDDYTAYNSLQNGIVDITTQTIIITPTGGATIMFQEQFYHLNGGLIGTVNHGGY